MGIDIVPVEFECTNDDGDLVFKVNASGRIFPVVARYSKRYRSLFGADEATRLGGLMDKPKQIWIERDDECPYFYVESELADASPPLVRYVRADEWERRAKIMWSAMVTMHTDEYIYGERYAWDQFVSDYPEAAEWFSGEGEK